MRCFRSTTSVASIASAEEIRVHSSIANTYLLSTISNVIHKAPDKSEVDLTVHILGSRRGRSKLRLESLSPLPERFRPMRVLRLTPPLLLRACITLKLSAHKESRIIDRPAEHGSVVLSELFGRDDLVGDLSTQNLG